MTKYIRTHALFLILIIFLNSVIVSDYLFFGTKAANFDATTHVTTIAQFHKAMSEGDFPVGWADGFGNYGIPLGNITHQLPIYIGALLTFSTHDPLLSFNLVYLITGIISAITFYLFLSIFFSSETTLIATILYSLAPYRILNLYTRGALPEFSVGIWAPLIFIAIYFIRYSGRPIWYLLLTLSVFGVVETHPLMVLIYAPIAIIWYLLVIKIDFAKTLRIGVAAFFGLVMSSYYFLPFLIESKYLYFGSTISHYARNQTTLLSSFINPFWRYSCIERNDIFGKCHLIKAGVLETTIMIGLIIVGLLYLAYRKGILTKKVTIFHQWQQYLLSNKHYKTIYIFVITGGLISILLSTNALEFLYERIRILGNIQFPWRFLSAYQFFPPIALALLYEYLRKYKWSKIVWGLLIAFIIFTRFPQLYGKNYTNIPISNYYFTKLNLHALTMNPIWTGDSVDYPVRREKAYIIRGSGQIINRDLKNSSRQYVIQADTELQVSDSTFYFPGWHVYVDGIDTDIQFQDPSYRGVITYPLSPGKHTVRIVYEDTKIRFIGKIISIISIVAFCVWGIWIIIKTKLSRKLK